MSSISNWSATPISVDLRGGPYDGRLMKVHALDKVLRLSVNPDLIDLLGTRMEVRHANQEQVSKLRKRVAQAANAAITRQSSSRVAIYEQQGDSASTQYSFLAYADVERS